MPEPAPIGILSCGELPLSLQGRFGPYSAMVASLLGERPTRVFDVPGGGLPAPDACPAYVITGSSAGVYDGLPWIEALMGFLRAARGRARVVGICFGHQAMAQAFGGTVIKSPKGWGVGLHHYEVPVAAPWMDGPWVEGGSAIAVPASHQDQVVTLPPGARVAAHSAFTPYAALDYGDAISFQFHPEFTPEFAQALIESERDRYGELAGPAAASHDAPHDCERVAGWIGRFLDGAPG